MSRRDRAVVFDVQRFSVHDGPGIRTVVFFKGCALDCAWCHNPEAVRPGPELTYWRDRCLSGCRECVAVCPETAIFDRIDARIAWSRCTHCGICATTCPADALVMVGREVGQRELLDEVVKDREFFATSGGGVTFSGGEPVLHSAFLEAFLPQARAEGLHLAIETCGAAPWELFEPLLPSLDLVLYDLKVMDTALHERLTGKGNVQIHEILRRLLARGIPVEVRMPVVPGHNTDDGNIRATAEFLAGLGIDRLSLLPYNHLWEAKLRALDTTRRPLGIRAPEPEFYRELQSRFEACGIQPSR